MMYTNFSKDVDVWVICLAKIGVIELLH